MTSTIPPLLSRNDLMRILKISPSTLQRWLRDDRLPAPTLINGLPRWPESDINTWLESQQHKEPLI